MKVLIENGLDDITLANIITDLACTEYAVTGVIEVFIDGRTPEKVGKIELTQIEFMEEFKLARPKLYKMFMESEGC